MATYTAVAAGGNWNAVATWGGGGYPQSGDTAIINATMTGTVTVNVASACTTLDMTNNGGTIAFGSLTLTVSNGATLAGTMTASTGGITVTGGGVTLAGNTGTANATLTVSTANQTLTSNGYTWAGKLTTANTITYSFNGNWTNTGLVTTGASPVYNKSSANAQLVCNGGISQVSGSGTITGTIDKIVIGGGTCSFAGSNGLAIPLDFNSGGTITLGTSISIKTTVTYVAGTIDSSTNSNTLTIVGNSTLNTPSANVTWCNVIFNVSYTLTLAPSSGTTGLKMSGTFTTGNASTTPTMSGAYDIECGTWKHATTGTGILTLVDGTTLIVNSGLQVSGSAVSIPTQLTAATGATLDYDGTSANAKVGFNVFNNITATHPIDVWYGGTHTGSTGFTNRTSADIGSSGGIMINPGLSGGLR